MFEVRVVKGGMRGHMGRVRMRGLGGAGKEALRLAWAHVQVFRGGAGGGETVVQQG